MTWILNIGDAKEGQKCGTCKHAETCNIVKVAPSLVSVLTSIDRCGDGHDAYGTAELKCDGYEASEETGG